MAPLTAALAVAPIVTTLGYIVWCYASPFGPCWWCRDGCLYCHGTGLRARLLWRLYRHATQIHRDSRTEGDHR